MKKLIVLLALVAMLLPAKAWAWGAANPDVEWRYNLRNQTTHRGHELMIHDALLMLKGKGLLPPGMTDNWFAPIYTSVTPTTTNSAGYLNLIKSARVADYDVVIAGWTPPVISSYEHYYMPSLPFLTAPFEQRMGSFGLPGGGFNAKTIFMLYINGGGTEVQEAGAIMRFKNAVTRQDTIDAFAKLGYAIHYLEDGSMPYHMEWPGAYIPPPVGLDIYNTHGHIDSCGDDLLFNERLTFEQGAANRSMPYSLLDFGSDAEVSEGIIGVLKGIWEGGPKFGTFDYSQNMDKLFHNQAVTVNSKIQTINSHFNFHQNPNWTEIKNDIRPLITGGEDRIALLLYYVFWKAGYYHGASNPPAVTGGPTVFVRTPGDGNIVFDNNPYTVKADIADGHGISKAEFYVNGTFWGSTPSAPWTWNWTPSSTKATDCKITVKAYGNGGAGDTTSATITVIKGVDSYYNTMYSLYDNPATVYVTDPKDGHAAPCKLYSVGLSGTIPYAAVSVDGVVYSVNPGQMVRVTNSGLFIYAASAYQPGQRADIMIAPYQYPSLDILRPDQGEITNSNVVRVATNYSGKNVPWSGPGSAPTNTGYLKTISYKDISSGATASTSEEAWTWMLTGVNGSRTLTVTMTDKLGTAVSKSVTVNYDQSKPFYIYTGPIGDHYNGFSISTSYVDPTRVYCNISFWRSEVGESINDATGVYSWGNEHSKIEAFNFIVDGIVSPLNGHFRGYIPTSSTAVLVVDKSQYLNSTINLNPFGTVTYKEIYDSAAARMGPASDGKYRIWASASKETRSSADAIDPESPEVSIIMPGNGNTVSGTVTIAANAFDNVGVTKVEFYIYGLLVSTDNTSPYAYSWTTTANGSYTLTAKAYDAFGNTGTSTINVTVSNPVTALPVVTTAGISAITLSTASGGGTVNSAGTSSVTARGVCWSTGANPTTSNAKTVNGSGTGDFTSSLTGLSGGTTYYVRAYATNTSGTAYGSEVSFTTSATVPALTTTAASSITLTTAASGGNISSDGGSPVTARGVCWSTGANPTTANSTTPDGSGTGSFASSLTGLSANTTYYVRAYATNASGTAYGNQISFTTAEDNTPPTLTLVSPSKDTTVTDWILPIYGTAWDNVGVWRVIVDGDQHRGKIADGTTNWSASLALAPGNNTIQVWAVDQRGIQSTIKNIVITCAPGADTLPPIIAITSPANYSTTTLAKMTVSGTWSDNSGITNHMNIFVNDGNGAAMSRDAITWRTAADYDLILYEGINNIRAGFKDASGNWGYALSSIKKGTGSNPAIPGNPWFSGVMNQSIGIQWDMVWGAVGYQLEYSLNNSTWSNCGPQLNFATRSYIHRGLNSGTIYYYRVKAIAFPGYVSQTGPARAQATYPDASGDAIAPSVNINTPVNNLVFSGGNTLNIKATADDNQSISRVEFYVDGSYLGVATAPPYEYNWTTPSKTITYALTAKAYDVFGNSSTSSPVMVTGNGAGPVGYWKFDEPLGYYYPIDASGNGNTGSCKSLITTGMYDESMYVPGKNGNGLTFTPAYSQYLEVPASTGLGVTTSYTIAGWVYLNALRNYDFIAGRGDGNANDIEVYGTTSGIQVVHNRGNGGTLSYNTTYVKMATGRWVHLGITNDNGTVKLYFDGVWQRTYTLVNPLNTNKPWKLGLTSHTDFGGNGKLSGKIDEFRIYNTALGAPEVLALNNGGPVADVNPPTCSITAPIAETTVSGTTTITASASDNVGVTKVEFYVAGALKGTDNTAPYTYDWNTTGYAAGSHYLVCKAYDASNNAGTSSTVIVNVTDLLAHWKLDETSGANAPDASGLGNNGTVYGATWTAGQIGNGLSFDGVDDYVNCGNAASLNIGAVGQSYSVSAWVRSGTKKDQSISEKWLSSGGAYPYCLRGPIGDGSLRFAAYDGTNNPCASATGSYADGKWHQVVGVRDATADMVRIYVDGVLKSEVNDNTVGNLQNTASVVIGRRHADVAGCQFNGLIDDVRIYSRALSSDEITILARRRNLAVGGNHSLALNNDGAIWSWGYNNNGQLGDGTTTQRTTPAQISGLPNVIAIAGGSSHTLALKSDGTILAWGLNSNGQLGDGTTTQRATPVQVSGLSNIIAIDAGDIHSLALKSDSTVWAWGSNGGGRLGDGTTTQRNTPVQVSGLSNVIAIAGSSHSIALKSDGTVWAWGGNGFGELGDGTMDSRTTPVQTSCLSGIAAVAVGGFHTLALKSDGTVWAWGYNGTGQLGDGIIEEYFRTTPVQASGLTNVIAITAGVLHSAAIKSDGTAWAWGKNMQGQLGDGTTTQRNTPVQVAGLANVMAIAGGNYHMLALKSDGTAWSWGENLYGQLGDGTTTQRNTPVQVSGLSVKDAADNDINDIVEQLKRAMPAVTSLMRCAPNPFTGQTTINFQLAKPAQTAIKVYNIMGQCVKTLINECLRPGYHNVKWDGKDANGSKVAAGVYLYRMSTEDYSKTNKMTVLR